MLRSERAAATMYAQRDGSSVERHVSPTGTAVDTFGAWLRIACIALIYSGAFLWLIEVSPLALYAFYALIGCLAGLALLFRAGTASRLAPLLPYVGWVLIYVLWGTLITPANSLIIAPSVQVVVRTVLIVGLVTTAVPNRRRFADLVIALQIVVVANTGFAILQAHNPTLLLAVQNHQIADPLHPPEMRPAGLWVNPDEGAFALLFAVLLARGRGGLLAWSARVAAIVGIYLGASRSGMYLLLLCLPFFIDGRLYRRITTPRGVALLALCLAVMLAGSLWIGTGMVSIATPTSGTFQLQRLLDWTEQSAANGYSRREVTGAAMQAVLAAPWQGYGIFALQGVGARIGLVGDSGLASLSLGAHNIYLAVWGEVGLAGLCLYLLVLGLGLWRTTTQPLATNDRITGLLLWLSYLLLGLVWHDQFTDWLGIFYVTLLFAYPGLMRNQRSRGAYE